MTMNILNNKNKRISIFKTLALCLFAAVSLTLVSCDDDMDIQQHAFYRHWRYQHERAGRDSS